jgi:hypothetical protein
VELFSPDTCSLELIRQTFPILFNTEYTTISIHLRGNEYIRNSHIGKPWDYAFYSRAIMYMKETINNPVFLIFSDDMESLNDQNKVSLMHEELA